jgi:hypothetical protein
MTSSVSACRLRPTVGANVDPASLVATGILGSTSCSTTGILAATTLAVGISAREEERHGLAVHRPKGLGAASAAA